MKIPKQIKAFGYKYPIKRVKKIKGGFTAEINHKTQVIQLTNYGTKERQEEALLHEILHLISCEQGLKLKEKVVERISQGLYHIFQDNNFFK